MFTVNESTTRLDIRSSSQTALIDRITQATRHFVTAITPAAVFTGIEQAQRELLLNAIEHGNLGNPERIIGCGVESLGGERFKITVTNEGPPINPADLTPAADLDPAQVRSRGYAIINTWADEIEFSKLTGEVSIFVTVTKTTSFDVTHDGTTVHIKPRGDLTAQCAEALRTTLLDALSENVERLCIDLCDVVNLDSISLSILALLSRNTKGRSGKTALVIEGANEEIRALFRLTRMDEMYALN